MKIPLLEPLQQMCSQKRVGEIYLFKTLNEDPQWSDEEEALATERATAHLEQNSLMLKKLSIARGEQKPSCDCFCVIRIQKLHNVESYKIVKQEQLLMSWAPLNLPAVLKVWEPLSYCAI
jgi:hypothetical protein